MRPSLRVRQAANWANLSTPAGLLLAAVSRTRTGKGPGGLILATGYGLPLPKAAAFTVGNVVLCRVDRDTLKSHPRLLAHEARHSTQYACCLGLPFFPLYAACALYSQWRTGNPGTANVFERLAGLADGGYPRPAPTQKRKAFSP
ncbi:hypothetical protein [Specibacter cremeus]|uniref:hypothetical protein n=1 Tax=Specibacter cremeus TaxID=1629051 RepID=UPI000F7B9FB5|nr:hypothetical protein [Specibacter cremeus]